MPSVDVVWKGNCRAILIRSALEWARRTAIVAHGRTCLHRVRPQAPRASPRYKPPVPCPSSPTRGSADGPRRRSLRDRRVAPGQAAAPGPESPPSACAQPPSIGSDSRWGLFALHAPCPGDPLGDRAEAADDPGLPSDLAPTQVPLAVFTEAPWPYGSQGSVHRTGGCHCRDEAAKPRVGVSAGLRSRVGLTFDIQIDKDVVRRVLATHYRPEPDSSGPSWLTFLGHAKDSLWSIDMFRCESAILRSHWVLVVMDQYTRRIVGFGIHAGVVDSSALRGMFNHAVRTQATPKYLSSDNDPRRWCANPAPLAGALEISGRCGGRRGTISV